MALSICTKSWFEYGISWFILYKVQSKMICISSPFCSIVHCCFFGGFSSISSGDGRLYFWSVFRILQMNHLSSSFEFSISHMSISFSMDESSLAKVVNKITAFLCSVVSIGSAPISV